VTPAPRPVVFVGPSISLDLAARILPAADYRPPIRRGDLGGISPRTIVGIIDGVFAATLAISPGEIRDALARGVVVYGAASMGALRAAEVREMIGVGRIFDMYRSATIERDDEVALVFDPETHLPLTQPLVNLRYAVERLVRSATLPRDAGDALIGTATRLHYSERTYPNVIRQSPLANNVDADEIARLLGSFDLKRDDAQSLLEAIATADPPEQESAADAGVNSPEQTNGSEPSAFRVRSRETSDAPVLVWESGDVVGFPALVRFLKLTGTFETLARNAIARMSIGDLPFAVTAERPVAGAQSGSEAQALLDGMRVEWGWESGEEAHVTMRDLGLGLDDVADLLQAESRAATVVEAAARAPSDAFKKALRVELWTNELALKREVLRVGAVRQFAEAGAAAGPPTEAELEDARRCVARLRGVLHWPYVQEGLHALGLAQGDLDADLRDLALARRAAGPLVAAMERGAADRPPTPRAAGWRTLGLALESSPKAPGSSRFAAGERTAAEQASAIAGQLGIQRIGLVGELASVGVHVAQAFAERSGWSASFSSGKAESREGARIGSIMEEAELQAQDAFDPPEDLHATFAAARADHAAVDPRTLALPFDSGYSDDVKIAWSACSDLLGGGRLLVPSACLTGERLPNDILYSPRLGGKIFSSSGLGSGFTMAEAAVHATAELIERHAQRLAELQLDNPGKVGARQFWFVDPESLPETPRRIVAKYRDAGMSVRILDMTCDIAVPAFYARIFEDPFAAGGSTTSDGFACHPDPDVAVAMALLEAAQTKAGFIAGGREDFSLQARSLGRHERPRTALASSQVFWFSSDRPTRPLSDTPGLRSGDILDELEWMVDRVHDAGYPHLLLADFTTERIAPARAVRMILPGSETTNPLSTGPRARVTCIRDLVPAAPSSR
jgi:ribosomal protein S12 methylthiotransferase accessory factor